VIFNGNPSFYVESSILHSNEWLLHFHQCLFPKTLDRIPNRFPI